MVDIYQLALTKISGVGLKQQHELIKHLGSAERLFTLPLADLQIIFKNKPNSLSDIIHRTMFKRCEEELEFMNKWGIDSYFFTDEDYPKRLKQIPDSPICLFKQGKGNVNAKRTVAIVGSRNATEYGIEITKRIVDYLKNFNCTIISGLAYGIDCAAHTDALDDSIPTFGILGHGLDMMYPRQNIALSQNMLETGGLITEYFTSTQPLPMNFPQRNRIIAGLSDLIIVVQAAKRGGGLLTARLANDYNREVMAVPGRIGDEYSEGCNFLIANNRASILCDVAEIDKRMSWDCERAESNLFNEAEDKGKNLKGNNKKIYYLIKEKGEISFDDIVSCSALAFNDVSSSILNLELMNLITTKIGRIYRIV